MITAQCYAVTCIIYNGLWGRKSKLPCAFGPHLLSELMSRKWNKWCKKHANIPGSFMWPLSVITLSVPTVNCLYKVKNPFHVSLFLFVLISVRAYGLHIWEMLSMVAPNPPYTPHPHTHCFCEVIHIWSSLLLLIITHDYYKQVLSWLAALSLLWKGNNVDFQDFKQTQELWRNDSESY